MAFREYEFRVAVRALGEGRTLVKAPGKESFEVAVPPEFGGTDTSIWSPEDLLVAAVASCYAVTLEGALDRAGVSARTFDVDGAGHVQKGPKGSVFTAIELRVAVEANEASFPAVEQAVRQAQERCLVGRALATPVQVALEPGTAAARRAA